MDNITPPQPGAGSPPLVHACFRGDIDTVARLLQAGADPSVSAPLILEGIVTDTPPLMAAAALGASAGSANAAKRAISARIIHELIEAGASIRAVEAPLLECLTIGGNVDALQVVLANGVRPRNQFTMAALAISHHQVPVLAVLKECGIDPNVTDGHGNTVLHHICSGTLPFFRDAAWHQAADPATWHTDRVRDLVGAGVDLDRRDSIGTTALMRAITSRQMQLARALVTVGADVNCRMRNGVAALHLAVAQANHGFVNLLLDQRIDRQDLLRMAMKRVQPDIKALIGTRIRSPDQRKSAGSPPPAYQGPDRRILDARDGRVATG